MLLSVLPDEARTDLSEAGYPGLIAVWRPMSVTDKALWFDACNGDVESARAKTTAVRQQLIRVEGIHVEEEALPNTEPLRVPFDGQNPKHFAALPFGVIIEVFYAILARTAVNEKDAKN